MAIVDYLNGATNETYSDEAFAFIKKANNYIINVADALGISASAIAGAMAEENTAYTWWDDGTLDIYAKSGLDPAVALTTLPRAIAGGVVGTTVWLAANRADLATTRTHAEWQAYYSAAISFQGKPGVTDKIANPALIDAGPANFKIATAIDLIVKYGSKTEYAALGLASYLNDYVALVNDLMDSTGELTAKLYGLYMKEYAEPFFKSNNAYGGQWDSLPQTLRDALLVTYTNIGEAGMTKLMKTPYEPQPALLTGGGMNHLRNAEAIGEALGLTGYGSDAVGVDDFVGLAKTPGEPGVAARYALKQLRHVAVEGIDYSAKNPNGELDLYNPATGTGQITEQWIHDRAEMLQFKNLYDSRDLAYGERFNYLGGVLPTPVEGDYIYNDMTSGISLDIDGVNPTTAASHQIVFGGNGADSVSGGSAEDHLYGGAGADVLDGKGGNDYLEGGEGKDTYRLRAGEGVDTIVDTDGQGVVEVDGSTVSGVFTSKNGGEIYYSADGQYKLRRSSEGYQLFKQSGEDATPVAVLKNWSSGQLGIQLEEESQSPQPRFQIEANHGGRLTQIWGGPKAMDVHINNGHISWVMGSPEDDVFYMGSKRDIVLASLGNDWIYGGESGDYLAGGPGSGDSKAAENDRDRIIGGTESDILNGGIGDDVLIAMDHINEGTTGDEGDNKGDWLMGGKGEDELHGSTGADILGGGAGNDNLSGGGGNDLILGDAHLLPKRQSITVMGDAMEWTWDSAQQTYTSAQTGAIGFYHSNTFLWTMSFTENDYTLSPTNGLNTLFGEDKRVMDGGGSDLLHGGAGNDWIAGQTGDDTLYGDEGNDILYGDDSVPLPSGSAAGNDILYAGGGADILHGGDGHDQLRAEEADGDQDRLYGEAGDDLLYGGSGRDLLDGGADNDGLFAGSDGSTLIGGSGNDFFRGGAGDDTQQDASGNDTYHFSGGTDTITDTEGNDQYLLFSNALSGGGVTTVQDADGVGRVYLDGVLIDGKGLLKRSDQHWESTDGRYTLNRDGGQLTVRVTGQAGQVIFQNYSDGALGITLPSTPVNPPPDPDPKPGNEAPKTGVPLEARQTIEQDQRFSYDLPTGAFTDPDGDALRLGAKRVDGSALPSWLIFDAATGQFSGTPENADVGTLSIRVTATDPDGESTFQDFTLDIINRNDAPEVGVALTPQQAKEGQPWSYTPEADSFIDPDQGDTLHYSATLADGSPLPSWLAFDPVTGGFSGTPPTGTAGDVLLRLIATDDSGASVSQDFSLSVSPAQGQPDPNPIRGTPGNDSLYGTPGSDTLDGQGGDDWLNGGQGDDIYVFGRGYGRDTVWDYDGTAGNRDVVRLEPGIVSSDVRVTRDGANLVLNLDSGEQLVLSNWYIDPANRIEELHFADGTVWDAAQLGAAAVFEGTQGNDALGVGYTTEGVHFQGLAGDDQLSSSVGDDWLDGGEGNDTLYASDGADILDGGQGNDTLNGGSGNDTYLFGQGYGQDTIWDYDQSAGNHDRIQLGDGIDPSHVEFTRDANHLILGLEGGERLVIQNWYIDPANRIEELLFADGTVWDAARMSAEAVYEGTQANDALGLGWTTEPVHMRGLGGDDQLSSSEGNDWLEGGAGNDTLYAANGADILDGGAGRDWLDGGLGNDTYHFGVDYGQDTIWDYDWNADNTDTVVFGNDVSVDQLWFRRVGNNLEVSLIGRDDALTINNWYAGDANHIEIFRTADGKQLLDDQVDALVNAMASFAPPAAGQTTLPPSYQSALMPVLSANWH